MQFIRDIGAARVARTGSSLNSRIKQRIKLFAAAAFVTILSACGGGGGSESKEKLASAARPIGLQPPTDPMPSSADATRLLDQASFGATDSAILDVKRLSIAGWIDSQLAAPATGYAPIVFIDPNSGVGCPTGSPPTCFRDNYTAFPLQLQFYRNAVNAADQLRQRVAFAYSQIFVISAIDIKETYAMREYQQMLLDNAFGNYRDLLLRVTLSPAMGDYLDMVNNDKPNPAKGIEPNENYAREIMQLFSIGLVKLNADGSAVKDSSGVPIPSYDQDTVEGFAHAFTGWTYAPRPGATSKWTNPKYYFGSMVSFPSHHDTVAKVVLDGKTLPAGQSPQKDLADALDNIFNHPNVGPFIGRQLIQFLVTSNPTPQYVARVAAAFNDNGLGVRGDMKAVVRAVLLDAEARGDAKTDLAYGKLRDPALYATGIARAFGAKTDGVYLNSQSSNMGTLVYTPGSVFNFFPPGYALPGSATLVAPQFGVQNTTTTVARLNFANALIRTATGIAPDPTVSGSIGTTIDLTGLQALAATPVALVDKLDALMTHSTMTSAEKNTVVTAINAVAASDTAGRARAAAYLVAASPRYQITR